jgi:hypothetical protein
MESSFFESLNIDTSFTMILGSNPKRITSFIIASSSREGQLVFPKVFFTFGERVGEVGTPHRREIFILGHRFLKRTVHASVHFLSFASILMCRFLSGNGVWWVGLCGVLFKW